MYLCISKNNYHKFLNEKLIEQFNNKNFYNCFF